MSQVTVKLSKQPCFETWFEMLTKTTVFVENFHVFFKFAYTLHEIHAANAFFDSLWFPVANDGLFVSRTFVPWEVKREAFTPLHT